MYKGCICGMCITHVQPGIVQPISSCQAWSLPCPSLSLSLSLFSDHEQAAPKSSRFMFARLSGTAPASCQAQHNQSILFAAIPKCTTHHSMPPPSVAANVSQSLDVQSIEPAKISLNCVLVNLLTQYGELLFTKLSCSLVFYTLQQLTI